MMLVFWDRWPTIGGPRPETWRWLCALVAPKPIYYMNRTRHYWMSVDEMRKRGVLISLRPLAT